MRRSRGSLAISNLWQPIREHGADPDDIRSDAFSLVGFRSARDPERADWTRNHDRVAADRGGH